MQISRHWRLNANRYRLEGYLLADGKASLEPRLTVTSSEALTDEHETNETSLELPAVERTAA